MMLTILMFELAKWAVNAYRKIGQSDSKSYSSLVFFNSGTVDILYF